MPPCSLLSPTGFLANITLQSIPGFIPLTEVCLNPGLFCLALHTTLWSVRKMNSKPIFTAQYPIIDLAFNTYTLLTSSSSPHSSIFFQSHTNITYVTAHHTRSSYSFYTWYSNAASTFETNPCPQQYHLKFIPRHHDHKEIPAFR